MNEKTIELPPRLQPCPFCSAEGRETSESDPDYLSKRFMFIQCTRCGARTGSVYGSGDPSEWADARSNWNTRLADRARQASEPGEVARLAEAGNDLATIMRLGGLLDEVARVLRGDPPEKTRWGYADLPDRVRAVVNLAAALTSMATSPASEAQAGWVPLRISYPGEDPEDVAFGPQIMMDRLQKWLSRYFAMLEREKIALASAPLPASSPVAAEGQKAVTLPSLYAVIQWLENGCDPKEAAKELRLYEEDRLRQSAAAWRANPSGIATPTASMADAAEAPINLTDLAAELWVLAEAGPGDGIEDRVERIEARLRQVLPTPGPRGENAVGVVEALSQREIDDLVSKSGTTDVLVRKVERNRATAWGLRIAEKGDAS